ncbi:Dynein light chain [Cladophialophora chaetospira]|uniref:Dynein light chain n=1 Tax=Cladophialophora chaetospira TaxID=386627 RepID=A0AA38XNQ6_9EURO|nr:Dynein light chain [Cladophialophora chaetospira]
MAAPEPAPEKKVKLERESQTLWTCKVPAADAREAQIKSVDMSEDMQQEAIEVGMDYTTGMRDGKHMLIDRSAQEAMEKFSVEKDIAQHIKREFDSKKGATWHCIVGRNFGSFVTHETKHFIYFYLGHVAILLFKTQ